MIFGLDFIFKSMLEFFLLQNVLNIHWPRRKPKLIGFFFVKNDINRKGFVSYLHVHNNNNTNMVYI